MLLWKLFLLVVELSWKKFSHKMKKIVLEYFLRKTYRFVSWYLLIKKRNYYPWNFSKQPFLYKTLRWLLFVFCVNKASIWTAIFIKGFAAKQLLIFKQPDIVFLFVKDVLIRTKRFYSYLIYISESFQLGIHRGNNHLMNVFLVKDAKMWCR